MNVLFDISVLGAANLHQRSKTGIFRVVYNLAVGLINHPDLSVKFCSPESLLHLNETMTFLAGDDKLSPTPFCQPNFPGFPGIRQKLNALQAAIAHTEGSRGRQALSAKALRTFRMLANRMLGTVQALDHDFLLDRKYLRGADIYHSPFHAFPTHAKKDASPRTKFFLTVHDLIPIKFPQYFTGNNTRSLERTLAAVSPADWVLCVSESTRNDLLEYRPDLDPAQVRVTPLAASALFHPCTDERALLAVRRKHQIPDDAPYFLSLSTLEPRKNIGAVIRAFSQLIEQEKNKDLYLVLAGPLGWNFTDILSASKNSTRLEKRILFTGFVDDADMAPLYSGALAFVYPSLYEGFGLPPLEAMQCGTPVITSNVSSLPEVVGDAGILINPCATDSLTEEMKRLLNNSKLRENFSKLSIHQSSKFSWQKTTKLTIEHYRTAV